jgi:tetratricopeptide (TPR) repeat protein
MSHSSGGEAFSRIAGNELLRIASKSLSAKRFNDALKSCQDAIKLLPNDATAWGLLGTAFQALKRQKEASEAFTRALEIAPERPDIMASASITLLELRKFADALGLLERALSLSQTESSIFHNRAVIFERMGRFEDAAASYRMAISLRADDPDTWYGLGNALYSARDLDASVDAYSEAIRLRPKFAEAFNNRGRAQRSVGRIARALEDYAQAIELSPQNPDAHWNRAIGNLLEGRMVDAWEDFEWRWKTVNFPNKGDRFTQPLWQGEEIEGKSILLHAEQGLGDTIQFCRYAEMVAGRGATVYLEVPAQLHRLCSALKGVTGVIKQGDILPSFDFHCPLMSLPFAFKTTQETIPHRQSPYIVVGDVGKNSWREKFSRKNPRKIIGLVWAGNPQHPNDGQRSVGLDRMFPIIAGLPDSQFVSFQVGERAGDLKKYQWAGRIIDLGSDLIDFHDTASALSAIDVLISVDTSVLHLAGAIGIQTLALIPRSPDWRWMARGGSTAWYPGTKLYRQGKNGDWADSILKIRLELGEKSNKTRE